ncbi:hypothetical protein BV25DRAFT_1832886 [Artomyces pyxidatus]|uniref:Uncharacterized protein n=1 Tax=Artomyces pyxidatus TaxID=48021 RepID=A0ACB8SH31_9AGAM|nr:hypothetical protein BV25DRAFT_1832886 [Artomyces pyxidatus]
MESQSTWCVLPLPQVSAQNHYDYCARVDSADTRLLLEYHNSCSPVNLLPVEVLARIFSFSSRAEERPESFGAPIRPKLGWTHITFVCRRWRHVALNHAALWANIDFALGYWWAKEMISRSKSMPLILDRFQAWQPLTIPQGDLIIENMSRIEVMRLDADIEALDSQFDRIICEPVPLLKEHCIIGTVVVDLSGSFLGGFASNLRTLNVQNTANFPWESSILKNLVSFRLAFRDKGLPRPSPEEFFSALNTIHRLESFNLHNCVPTPTDESDITVKLPCLASFEGWNDVRKCTYFLVHLDIPTMASINVGMYYLDSEPEISEAFTSLAPAIAGFLRGHGNSSASISALSLDDTSTMFAVTAIRPDAPRIYMDFQPELWTARGRKPVLAARVLAALSSEHLKHLSVKSTDIGWSPFIWLDIVAGAPGVQTISADGQAAEMLCLALRMSAGSSLSERTSLGTGQLLLPGLQQLSLRGLDLTAIAHREVRDRVSVVPRMPSHMREGQHTSKTNPPRLRGT